MEEIIKEPTIIDLNIYSDKFNKISKNEVTSGVLNPDVMIIKGSIEEEELNNNSSIFNPVTFFQLEIIDLIKRSYKKICGNVSDKDLDNIIRSSVYETSVIKKVLTIEGFERSPTVKEINEYKPELLYEIMMIQPKTIICMGRHSFKALFGKYPKLEDDNGNIRFIELKGLVYNIKIPVLVTYSIDAILYREEIETIIDDNISFLFEMKRQKKI